MVELSEILKNVIHYGLHFFISGLIAYVFFRKNWKKVWLIFVATMLIDIDHLLADPIFDPERCSINFHPLHTYYAFIVYLIGTFFKPTRIISIGLIFHLLTDWIDCWI